MHSPLPEMTLEQAATEVRYVERSLQLSQTATVELGPEFTDPRAVAFFGAKTASVDVRNFVVDDVFLDTACMVLVKDGHRISDTRYLLPQPRYDGVQITPNALIPLDSGIEYVLARSFDNWYHWLVQTLPTIDHALRGSTIAGTRILMHPVQRRWQRETLGLLGYDDMPQIALDSRYHYHVPRVQYLEFINGRTSFRVSHSALDTYRRLRDAGLRKDFVGPRIIYVARTDTALRALENEKQIVAALERVGVTPIVAGQLTVSQQINLFHNADAVIGSHGAGMSNIVFCKAGTIIYEFHPSHYLNPCMARLAQAADLHYVADQFPSRGEGGPHDRTSAPDIGRILQRVGEIKARLPQVVARSSERPSPKLPNRIRDPLILPPEILAVPSDHQDAIAGALRMEADLAGHVDSPHILFVCFTNRSGSNLLCEMLSATGYFNTAQESFNASTVVDTCRAARLESLGAYFGHIAATEQKNGIFVVKVAADHVVALVKAGILDAISNRVSFLWCQRVDKLGQAVSLSIAGQNHQWSSHLTPTVSTSELQYSAEDIADKIRWITVQEYGLASFFAVNGIQPMMIEYDWLVKNPQTIVNEIADRIGVPYLIINTSGLRLQKQARPINAAWREQFLSDPLPGVRQSPRPVR